MVISIALLSLFGGMRNTFAQVASDGAQGATRAAQKNQTRLSPNQVKNAITKRRDERVSSLQEKRQEATENFKEKRLEFKNRLDAIQDAQKKQVAQRIDQKMGQLNATHTARMNNILESFDQLLGRFIEKAQNLQKEGVDALRVDEAISQAQHAIATAQFAVEAQAGKDYVIVIEGDETLKGDFKTKIAQLRQDLTVAKNLIIEAKKAIALVARELALVRKQGRNQNTSTQSAR
ncbi:MAG: hypothetical protein A3J69_01150 [Candidatus Levybacteria bacterium RIFCSPHIGHO2_02_FULL_42_12]|nr:MAG: hypothetical protein A3J69_01150 [Candidatus Levybacteria bacterium RIFCSPHIGHO2_02_FULL_42_12]OGH43025.1 MAG: hypothetical protein A3B53_00130 [Candidatus Levybacteria bacterium RIFCSPLOWO2_01_FULL_42_15]